MEFVSYLDAHFKFQESWINKSNKWLETKHSFLWDGQYGKVKLHGSIS